MQHKPWLQLRFDCDTTTIRLRRIVRACFHSTRFDASKTLMSIFRRSRIVVVSQSNRNCNHGLISQPAQQYHISGCASCLPLSKPITAACCFICQRLLYLFKAFLISRRCDWTNAYSCVRRLARCLLKRLADYEVRHLQLIKLISPLPNVVVFLFCGRRICHYFSVLALLFHGRTRTAYLYRCDWSGITGR